MSDISVISHNSIHHLVLYLSLPSDKYCFYTLFWRLIYLYDVHHTSHLYIKAKLGAKQISF